MDTLTAGFLDGRERPADDTSAKAAETTGGGAEPVSWVEVATAMGTPNAVIIAGRLESHKIPTRVTQEAAGVHAFAVNVGMFGMARVWVPEEYQEQAETILEKSWDEEE